MKKQSKVKILVCCHKNDIMAAQEPYMPIQVGKAISNIDLGIIGDDTGDNISHKNRSYCELTGMYWAWKNLKDVDVIGLCHYRRYFDFHKQCPVFRDLGEFFPSDFTRLDLSIPNHIIKSVVKGTVVAARPKYLRFSLRLDYCYWHISDDFRILRDVVEETQPIQYQRAFHYIMCQNNVLMPYNMFLMSWNEFDRYCSWLFGVLEEVEKRVDILHYNSIQDRIFGYMAERLFNVYLYAEKVKVKRKPIIWITDGNHRKIPFLKMVINVCRGWLSVKISAPKMPRLLG